MFLHIKPVREDRFETVKSYYEDTGIINIPQNVVVNGFWIGNWIVAQKKAMEEDRLSNEQVSMLMTLPIGQVGARN